MHYNYYVEKHCSGAGDIWLWKILFE